MKLEELEKKRAASKRTGTIPVAELCSRYENVFTAAVNDVLREMGYLYQTLPQTIMPLRDNMKVAGIAFTIKGSKNLELKDEMRQRAEMLQAIEPGSICIWDTCEDDESAQWGEIMTMASIRRGCRGAVIDGGIRDTDRLLDLKFPVFSRYRTSNGMLGRFRLVGYQMPIRIGDVLIRPGDVVLGDIDGVIIVPAELAEEVLVKSEEIRDNEVNIKKMVVDGLTPTEIVEQGGYF